VGRAAHSFIDSVGNEGCLVECGTHSEFELQQAESRIDHFTYIGDLKAIPRFINDHTPIGFTRGTTTYERRGESWESTKE